MTGDAAHSPALSAHRLIGDGRSAALVRPDGEIDWWCAPDLDSPPLCWSLLDAHGGAARWPGVVYVDHEPGVAGPSARTRLRLLASGAAIECRDGLVGGDIGASTLVRLVRRLDGDLDVVHELALGGFDGPWARWDGTGPARVTGGRSRTDVSGRLLCTRLTARRGQWAALAVAVGTDTPDLDPTELAARLDRADAAASAATRRASLPGHHPGRAADALRVLRACTFAPTGAVVASPTTSLPESPGHDRQFDYRYSWLRDASLAVSVAALLGHRHMAERYLDFLHGEHDPGAVVTDVRGGPVPAERDLAGVSGWGGSRPVRVGNAARGQAQYDALGMVVEAVSVYLQTGGRLRPPTWDLVRQLADHAAGSPQRPTSGIWELRRPRPLVSADIGRWLTLDRALWIARGWRPTTRRRRWRDARDECRRRVLAAVGPDGGLPQAYGDHPGQPDASALMAVVFGMVGRRDPRASRLVDATLAGLASGPFLYRYPPGGDDGFSGLEGAFIPVSWWAVSALAACGRYAEARDRADALDRALPGLMSEEVDPASGALLGNVPLVWSHMEAARALYLLDAERRRRRWGSAGLWAWRIGRYLRLRLAATPAEG